uniref:CSON008114 protein n=1 Tax=Culicoides sonorensis TaxID=179676 RepID=A0A336LZ15_CULSO
MVVELNVNQLNNHRSIHPESRPMLGVRAYNDNNGTSNGNGKINNQQLEEIKTSLLSPNEVTFNVSDDEKLMNGGVTSTPTKMMRHDMSDTDSIVSSIATTNASTSKKKPNIPDGGYGWVVVGASFVVSLIADGISFSFGLIYSELLHNFDASPSVLAWVGSLFLAVPLLAGPVMSNLVDKYGCRRMTMIGGTVSCLGFALAAMSNSVGFLYLTFGILAGIGLGVEYVTAVVSIAFWFDKKRTFATGIGASGTGLGTFIFAPLTQYLIESYGWRGATLLLAGALLNFAVCGALMRDPDWLIEENLLESRSESMQTFSPQASNLCLDEIKKLIETGAPKEDILETLVTNYNTEANQKIPDQDIVKAKKYLSEMILPTYFSSHEEFDINDKRASRRSLRNHVLSHEYMASNDDPTPTHENSYSYNHIQSNPELEQTPDPINCKLASTETLNSWEKIPSTDILSHRKKRLSESESMDEGFLTYHNSTINKAPYGSRYSLDDTMILKPIDRFKQELDRSLRGASLDVVRENEIFQIKPHNDEVRIDMPHNNNNHQSTSVERRVRRTRTAPPAGLRAKPSLKYPNYFRNMRIHRNSIHYRGAMLNTHRYRLRASSCPNIYRNSMTTIARETEEKWYDDFIDIIKSIFDFSLFLEYKFGMMSLSTFIIPYFYITEHMLKFGYKEEDSAMLISIIGAFNTIGMVVLGYAGDQPQVNVTKTMWHFRYTYANLRHKLLDFGSTLHLRLVNLDDFTCAYGLILLVQGLGSLVGPPLAGMIYDFTLRWDDSFYAAGFFIAISGVLSWLIGTLDPVADDDD